MGDVKQLSTTLKVPGQFADLLRAKISEEMAADADDFPSREPEQREAEDVLDKLAQHRDAIDQLGWKPTGRDAEITATSVYLTAILKSVLGSISETIASNVGEYRGDNPLDLEDTKLQAENLQWFAQALEGIAAEPQIEARAA